MTDSPELPLAEQPTDLPVPPPDEKWELDWLNGPEVIIREYGSIALYTNTAGSVIIRQESPDGPPAADSCVFLSSVEAIHTLIAALKREIGGVK